MFSKFFMGFGLLLPFHRQLVKPSSTSGISVCTVSVDRSWRKQAVLSGLPCPVGASRHVADSIKRKEYTLHTAR